METDEKETLIHQRLHSVNDRLDDVQESISNQNKAITENRERILLLENKPSPDYELTEIKKRLNVIEGCLVSGNEYRQMKEEVHYIKKYIKIFSLLCIGALINMVIEKYLGEEK